MALCAACTAISIPALTAAVDDPPAWLPRPSESSGVTGMVHLPDARQLPRSAAACSFCALIAASVLQNHHLTSDDPPYWDEADLASLGGIVAAGPVYLQLRRNGVGRLPRERPRAHLEKLGKAIAVFLPGADGVALRGRIRLYAQPDSPASTSGDVLCGPPLPSSDCPDAFRMTREWLSTCLNYHPSCRRTLSKSTLDETDEPVLPSRVIDVAPPDGSANVRLLQPMGASGRYVTLSHCWGPQDRHPLTTIKATLPQHLTEISWHRLPKTFRDAITVVRTLGLRYIWIDSLCIVQDDHDDWLRESEQMGMIYERAVLTIAACHARDSTEGCFFERPPARPAVQLPYWNSEGKQEGHLHCTLLPVNYFSISPEFSPLSERAWATQEWLLSRRVIFYTRECIVWSCRTITQRETRDSFHDTARNTRWKIIVEKYSARKLTNATDRLVALKGLANEMQKVSSTRCIYGVWADTLADGLLWFPLQAAERDRSPNNFPTWTWASTCHGVRYQKIERAKRISRRLRISEHDDRVVEATGWVKKLPHLRPLPDVTLKRQDSGLSAVSQNQDDADPRLTGVLLSIESNLHDKFSSLSFDLTEHPLGWALTHLVYDSDQEPVGWALFDEGKLLSEDVYSLAVLGKEEKQFPNGIHHYWILLLVHCGTDGDNETYRRVGVGKIESPGWYADTEMRKMRIV
ncbi:heterokaryon incompatibility protein [Diplodia corticola]|uniref:Heterokaryon incompatibility protein n=1 Tax=Diplodia corticola TaxID=236234 RepID=A0A1J9RKA7_9PEZI|nr:heterokaryon incompatibility protein [Diplodia corticola]OJD28951.1 heterokaryon incompatibility protein [Diplodia corticola]